MHTDGPLARPSIFRHQILTLVEGKSWTLHASGTSFGAKATDRARYTRTWFSGVLLSIGALFLLSASINSLLISEQPRRQRQP